MIEIADNAVQFVVTTSCALWAGGLAVRQKSQRYAILCCFYGTFALGLLYWLSFLALKDYTPRFFYVSDLSWVASFLFLLLLNLSVVRKEEKKFCPIAMVVAVVLTLLTGILLTYGDVLVTLIWCGFLIASAYLSTRGLLYARKQSGDGRKLQYLHGAILFIAFAEFCLWLLSCYFRENTLENPYFWCDYLLTAGLFALMPAAKKAVEV
ncbi:MAG: histidine kinase [Oscillospiraceae bacterium]